MTSACSIFPLRISSTVMSPALSGKPQALAPCDVHHVGLLAFGSLTPVPERSAVAATEAVQPPPFEASHIPPSVCACLSMMQRGPSVPAAGVAPAGMGTRALPVEPLPKPSPAGGGTATFSRRGAAAPPTD